MEHIIFAEGNIISRSGHHVMKSWVALADDDYKSRAEEIINGDLILNNNYPTRPYCTFAARGGVSCVNSNIEVLSSPENLVAIYNNEISKNKELAIMDVPQSLMRNHLKNVYAGVFSEFDVFLTEIFSTLVLGNKEFYEKYIEYNNNIDIDDSDCHRKVFKSLHGFFSLNLQKWKDKYRDILNINFPDISKIGNHMEFRHDVIHRSGKQIIGTHLENLNLSQDNLFILIQDLDEFVTNLMVALEGPITKWHN